MSHHNSGHVSDITSCLCSGLRSVRSLRGAACYLQHPLPLPVLHSVAAAGRTLHTAHGEACTHSLSPLSPPLMCVLWFRWRFCCPGRWARLLVCCSVGLWLCSTCCSCSTCTSPTTRSSRVRHHHHHHHGHSAPDTHTSVSVFRTTGHF